MSMKSSEPQIDLRVRRTHKLLWDALMAELSERSFDDVTVTDLCARAMVHRTTFYKHYQDKAALLERGTGQLLDALVSDSDHLPPSAYSVAQPPPYFVRLFEEAGKQQTFFRLLVCGDGVGHFQQMLRERIAEMATANVPAVPQPGLSADVAVAMHAHYVAGATVSLLAWWLEQGMPLSPRQMAQYLAAPHGHAPAPA